MIRDSAALDGRFDVLVVGGGIYGAWIAYDAALRGYRTALVEREDWASGTSSASSKLIHGGLRYLEYGEVGLVAKALRERGRLLRLGPHRVRGLRFLLPHWRSTRMPRLPLQAGLWLYDRLAGARPDLPRHRAWAKDEMLAKAPFLRGDDLIGGWSYPDAGEDDARMVLELVAGALDAGAVCVNHCPALRLIRAQGQAAGAVVRDALTNREHEVQARVIVDAAGAWADLALGLDPLAKRHTKGIHLVLPPLGLDAALLLTAQDGRVFFLIPFYGATLVGTTDTDHTAPPDAVSVTDEDVAYLLQSVATACPGLGWRREQVRGAFAGLRTLRGLPGAPSSVSREWELLEPEPGLLIPLGGKFTSARVEAVRTVDRVVHHLGGPQPKTSTAHRLFPWAPRGPWRPWLAQTIAEGQRLGLDAETARTCARRHGRRTGQIHALLRDHPGWATPVAPGLPFCQAEVIHAVQREMAISLVDVLRRRLPAILLQRLDDGRIAALADTLGAAAGWDDRQRQREITALTALRWRG